MKNKVAIVTCVYGTYEASCKPIKPQTTPVDLICFSNLSPDKIKLNGWELDNTPYHETHPVEIDKSNLRNSLKNNKHTYNIGKYYKFMWHYIPRLQEYDVVIWVDATVEIIHPNAVEMLVDRAKRYGICTWNHEKHGGNLFKEVKSCSNDHRFNSTNWFGQNQPLQPVKEQYRNYLENGYSESFWKNVKREEGRGDGINFGVWLTCMIAFDSKNASVLSFNELVYGEMKKWSTMCQIAFPKVVQDTNLIPYTLPDSQIKGNNPHRNSSIHIKHRHGN